MDTRSKSKKVYACEECKYNTATKSSYNRHISTEKCKKNRGEELKYSCERCSFSTDNLSRWQKHLSTERHTGTGKVRKSLPSTVRNSVWITYIGEDKRTAKCMCCGIQKIDTANYECGHIVSVAMGGDDSVSNLRPICGACNKSMGTLNMKEFMKKYGYQPSTPKNLIDLDDEPISKCSIPDISSLDISSLGISSTSTSKSENDKCSVSGCNKKADRYIMDVRYCGDEDTDHFSEILKSVLDDPS